MAKTLRFVWYDHGIVDVSFTNKEFMKYERAFLITMQFGGSPAEHMGEFLEGMSCGSPPDDRLTIVKKLTNEQIDKMTHEEIEAIELPSLQQSKPLMRFQEWAKRH